MAEEPVPRGFTCFPQLPLLAYMPDYLTAESEERLLRECLASRAKWTQLSGRRVADYGGHVHDKGLIPVKLPGWLNPLLQDITQLPHPGPLGTPPTSSKLFDGLLPNHVLVNSYQPGEGILPHEDGPAYHPVVAIVSLAAPAVIRFRRKDNIAATPPEMTDIVLPPPNLPPSPDVPAPPDVPQRPAMASLLLMPRSLLVFSEVAYTDYLHGIDEVTEEVLDESVLNLGLVPPYCHGDRVPRGTERVSLTVRRVRKVLPNVFKLR